MTESARTRRAFCTETCRALSVAGWAGVLGSLFEGCNTFTYPTAVSSLSTVNGREANGSVVVVVDLTSPLAVLGGAAIVQSSVGPLLLARTAEASFTALSGTCTHRTCAITGYAGGIFVCPCHGSQFDTMGKVVNGPAVIPLQQHTTQFAAGVLTIGL